MSLINKRLYKRILEKKKRLDNLPPSSPELIVSLRKELMIRFIYNSIAIEGSSLTLQEVRDIVEKYYDNQRNL